MSSNNVDWTFFSNHGHIYFLLASKKNLSLREIANLVGITERTVIAIVQDLVDSGFIIKTKVGRSNQYRIVPRKNLRHPLESKVRLKDLIHLIEESN
jgi:DNA-binding Lrp family transcriptional regulator